MEHSIVGDEVQAVSNPNRIGPHTVSRPVRPDDLVGDEIEPRDSSLVEASVSDAEDDGVIVEDLENVDSHSGQSDLPDRLCGDGR
jgi:hypothetical protein